jgi:hypothetical protein
VSKRGRESGQPVRHRRDQNRFDEAAKRAASESGADDFGVAPIRAERVFEGHDVPSFRWMIIIAVEQDYEAMKARPRCARSSRSPGAPPTGNRSLSLSTFGSAIEVPDSGQSGRNMAPATRRSGWGWFDLPAHIANNV